MIVLIAAVAENNALGKDNQLLWHLPDDLRFFKEKTIGHHIVMGRKTFESFPKALPKRTNVVITKQPNYEAQEAIVVHSPKDILALEELHSPIYIIGGGQIYKEFLPKADCIYLTKVHACFSDADTFFPEINHQEWELIASTYHPKDEKHIYSFDIQTFKRK